MDGKFEFVERRQPTIISVECARNERPRGQQSQRGEKVTGARAIVVTKTYDT